MLKKRQVYYNPDANLEILENKTIAVIGYGAQGRAQARMMHESGLKVIVGVRENGASWKQVKEDGLTVDTIENASQKGDIVHILIPDENQKEVYEKQIQPNLEDGNILSFSHGFNIVFDRIKPDAGVGVIMVAPKAPGTEEYKEYKKGFGVPALFSVHQENSQNEARKVALTMCKAMQFTTAGVMESSFAEEVHEDLFGEQAVLCGGTAELVKAGFETLVEAGYPPEFAYFECLHELKLIVDLMYQGGLTKMWQVVSNTAEYGGLTRGKRVVDPKTVKAEMKKILEEVESGQFAKEYLEEYEQNGFKNMHAMRQAEIDHPIEKVGARIRGMFKSQRD